MALEASESLALGQAFLLTSGHVRLGRFVNADLRDGHPVKRRVELSVPGSVQPMTPTFSGGDLEGGHPGVKGQLGLRREPGDPSYLSHDLCRGEDPATGNGAELRRDLVDEPGDLPFQGVRPLGELPAPCHQRSRDADLDRLRELRQASIQTCKRGVAVQCPQGHVDVWVDRVQEPPQLGLDLRPL